LKPGPHKDESPEGGEQAPLALGNPTASEPPKPTFNLQIPTNLEEKIASALERAYPEDYEYKIKQPVRVDVIKDEELTRFEKKTVRFGYWGLIIASCSLLAACIAAWGVFQQFKEMASQTELLSRSARQARRDSAEASLTTAQQLRIAQQQASAAQEQVRAVARQMRQDQRAWIKVIVYMPDKLPAPNVSIAGKINFENMGKTPAKNVVGKAEVQVVESDHSPNFKYHRSYPYLDAGYMFPNIPGEGLIWLGDDPKNPRALTKEERESLEKGGSYLVVYGTVAYADMFGVHHWVRFCSWHAFAETTRDYAAKACADYGKVDDQ
jgi:hypothetical protein